ncbi:gp217 [Synechococcus phage syn9]|uniref:Gp217 n=1 Tax=Synechococcus phage syn9 TaxID=382359 RepID=Q0QZ09_BPSYS|nr:gp217 [Synechococcus phage syn9]ABA47186.1 gp217 [Synechococcus phage syn9]
MITSETPYKLAEIIRDTWPQLFYLKKEKTNDNKYTTSTNKGVV